MAEENSESARIGVFGSAFNPPHLGHVAILAAAIEQLDMDRVLVVPTGNSYHKEVDMDPGKEVRLRLAEAAFGSISGVGISRVEVDGDGPSYTCETLEEIERLFPDSEIQLLMGADAAKNFAGWHRPERILELASVAVAPRIEVARGEVESAFAGLGVKSRFHFLEMDEVAISSSRVRQLIGNGGDYRHLVPQPVAEIIENEDLYGQSKD